MDQIVRTYIAAADPRHRSLLDRMYQLILEAAPDAVVELSYGMPTFKIGHRRLFLAAWRHGISIYGSGPDRDAGFISRHPRLKYGRGTVRLRPADAAAIADAEFRDLVRAALAP